MKPKYVEVLVLLVLITLGGRTIARNSDWESTVKLMSTDINHLQNSAQANYLLGIHTVKSITELHSKSQSDRQLRQGIHYFKKAIEIYPEYFNFHFDLGKAYVAAGDLELANSAFYKAQELEPDAILGMNELALNNFRLNKYEEALKYAKKMIAKEKRSATLFEVASFSAYYLDDYDMALKLINQSNKYYPNIESLAELKADIEMRVSE